MKNKVEHIVYTPKIPKSHSVDEILSSGGATFFAEKLGKSPKDLIEKLFELPSDAFLTNEELSEALAILNENK